MYVMCSLNDVDRLIATQRYYNLLKSILELRDMSKGITCSVDLDGTNLSWGHSVINDRVVVASFLLGEDEFIVDESVSNNEQWDKWVVTQQFRCVAYSKDRLMNEFLDFIMDYYPEFVV